MIGYLKRGAQRLAQGSVGPLRGGLTGALCVTDTHAKYQEAVLNGNVWIGSNPQGTPVTPQAGVSVTTPALVLFNPINSPVNLVLWWFEAIPTTVQAALSGYFLAYNMPALAGALTGPFTVTNANITNALLGQGQAQSATAVQTFGAWGQAYRICTLAAAPVAFRYPFCLGFNSASAAGVATSAGSFHDAIDGAVVIPPGIAVAVQAIAATPVVAALCWEEVPISN